MVHLAEKAEVVAGPGGLLATTAASLATDWAADLRLVVCDANLDIRDSLRELVTCADLTA